MQELDSWTRLWERPEGKRAGRVGQITHRYLGAAEWFLGAASAVLSFNRVRYYQEEVKVF
jgi:hypothetical protein